MHTRNFHSSVLTFCYFSPVFTKTVILSSYILQITQWTNICDLFNGKKTNQICNNLTGQLSSTGPHCRYSPSAALYTAYTALQQHFTLQIQPFSSTLHCRYSPSAALYTADTALQQHFTLQIQPFSSTLHCRYSPSAALYTADTALQQHFTLQIQPFSSTFRRLTSVKSA